MSFEALRINYQYIKKIIFDLIIVDEAHRKIIKSTILRSGLKNSESQISETVASLNCKRRLLLTGTPMQNDLDEFFSLASLAVPTIFDSISYRKEYTVSFRIDSTL